MNSYKIPHIEWPRLKTLSSSALRTGDALKCATPSLVNLQLTRPVSQEVALIALTLGRGFTAQTHPKLVAMKQGWLTEHPGRNSRNGCVMSCGYIKKCRNLWEVNKCVEIAFCSKSLLRKVTKAQYLYQWQSPSITSQIWCHVLTLAFDLLTIPCKNLELVRSWSVGVAHPHPERPFDFINQFWSASKGSCAGRGVSKSETVQKTETEALEVKPLSEDNQAATRKTGNKKGQQPIAVVWWHAITMTCTKNGQPKSSALSTGSKNDFCATRSAKAMTFLLIVSLEAVFLALPPCGFVLITLTHCFRCPSLPLLSQKEQIRLKRVGRFSACQVGVWGRCNSGFDD